MILTHCIQWQYSSSGNKVTQSSSYSTYQIPSWKRSPLLLPPFPVLFCSYLFPTIEVLSSIRGFKVRREIVQYLPRVTAEGTFIVNITERKDISSASQIVVQQYSGIPHLLVDIQFSSLSKYVQMDSFSQKLCKNCCDNK